MLEKQQSSGQGQWSDLPVKNPVGRPPKNYGRINIKYSRDVYDIIKSQPNPTAFLEDLVRDWNKIQK